MNNQRAFEGYLGQQTQETPLMDLVKLKRSFLFYPLVLITIFNVRFGGERSK